MLSSLLLRVLLPFRACLGTAWLSLAARAAWHGMAEPGSLDVDLPPDTGTYVNAWDDDTDEVDEVIGPQDLCWAGYHKVSSPA